MKNRALLLSVLAVLALGLAWWLLRPSPPAPTPAADVPSAPDRAPAHPTPAAPSHLPFIAPAEERPTNVPGAPPPEPVDDHDDPVMQAALRGELPVGTLGAPPSDLIADRGDELRDCWREHKGGGREEAELQIRFTIEGEEEENGDLLGRVTSVRVLDAQGIPANEPGPFEVCARLAVEDLDFVAPQEGASVDVTVPLDLQAGE